MDEKPRSVWWLVLVGIVAGVALGGGAFALFGTDDSVPVSLREAEPLTDQRANAVEFLNAWHRFRTGTYVAELRVERTVTGIAAPLVSDAIIVQAPPERVVNGWGGQTTIVGEKQQSCAFSGDESPACAAISTKESYEVETARELSILSDYFSGAAPLYRVSKAGDCFDLALYKPRGQAPWGDRAQVCFDDETGAFTLFETSSTSGRDRAFATHISPTVTAADFSR